MPAQAIPVLCRHFSLNRSEFIHQTQHLRHIPFQYHPRHRFHPVKAETDIAVAAVTDAPNALRQKTPGQKSFFLFSYFKKALNG